MRKLFAAPVVCTCSNEREFAELAAQFAATLRAGDVVALSGPLGSGKTTFVRAVVRALHGVDEGSSPTFTFRHRYDGDPPIEHLDFYRIRSESEIPELGLEEAFQGDAIVLIEWWGNAPSLLPEARWEIRIEGSGDSPRVVSIGETT
jgi:tRNA threonylcarbamoyl adenosine modification protein YjeE